MTTAALRTLRQQVDAPKLIVGGLIAVLVVVGVSLSDRFATSRNFLNVLEQMAALGFVSLGQTLVVIAGGIDLSIGAVVTASTVLLAGVVGADEALMVPMIVLTLLAGAAFGAMNGVVILRTGVHPLVVTLGTATVLNGVVLLFTLQPTGSVPFWFEEFAYGQVFGLPLAGLVMLALFLAVGVGLRYTALGRAVYAVGGSVEAARLSGIRTGRVTIAAYAASGFLAAMAGLYFVSRTGVGDPRVGDPLTLASITPVVVGGAILGGGRGGGVGTLLGVVMISLLNNLLNYMNVSTFVQWVVQGLIIIAAVSLLAGKGGRS